LKLRQQVANVRLHGLFREEEPFADLPIDETVCDKLEDLDLACRGILPDLTCGWRREWDDRAAASRAASRRSRFEATAVIAVPIQNLFPLSGVHESGIGAEHLPL
jgi:hypothetical protein